jgi:hypothetical protein
LQITSLAAGAAIVNAVFTQADFIEALAQSAVLVAGAASLRLVADHAHEFLGHGGRLSRFGLSGNGPMVNGLAVSVGKPAAADEKYGYWQNAMAERDSGGSDQQRGHF